MALCEDGGPSRVVSGYIMRSVIFSEIVLVSTLQFYSCIPAMVIQMMKSNNVYSSIQYFFNILLSRI